MRIKNVFPVDVARSVTQILHLALSARHVKKENTNQTDIFTTIQRFLDHILATKIMLFCANGLKSHVKAVLKKHIEVEKVEQNEGRACNALLDLQLWGSQEEPAYTTAYAMCSITW